MRAWLGTTVLVTRLVLGMTVKVTLACPSGEVLLGGRNPASGSSGERPVVGSSELNVHAICPVPALKLPTILTSRFFAGLRSTKPTKDFCPAGGIKVRLPKEMRPKPKVERSTFAGSS